ncbi:unnamed protein product [Caenorhabditis angaria]|uniref:Uncharacterized protein n=1 Tax=Caenorhabditis angaria TaxID=860376 RepID=A0A9P1N7V8_9PELO|nr:unnamed protein product [Caenorhabditis angaria]
MGNLLAEDKRQIRILKLRLKGLHGRTTKLFKVCQNRMRENIQELLMDIVDISSYLELDAYENDTYIPYGLFWVWFPPYEYELEVMQKEYFFFERHVLKKW